MYFAPFAPTALSTASLTPAAACAMRMAGGSPGLMPWMAIYAAAHEAALRSVRLAEFRRQTTPSMN